MTGQFPPIEEYCFLSDCSTGALLGPDGSVEWMCAPRFDSPSHFARILDRERGGAWEMSVEGAEAPNRSYMKSALVQESRWEAPEGLVVVHDFLALKPAGAFASRGLRSEGILVRIARCLGGQAKVRFRVDARPDYARGRSGWEGGGEALIDAENGLWLAGEPAPAIDADDGAPGISVDLRAGDAAVMALGYRGDTPRRVDRGVAETMLDSTVDAWRSWADRSHYDGVGAEQVHHSAMVLRSLMFEETGALLAAPTTSLPEWIGGVRNWDYRYAWHRDASLLVLSLLRLGHEEESGQYLRFLLEHDAHHGGELEPAIGIGGETEMPEEELDHLDGYAGSKPVRVGNDARNQTQLDGYGQVVDAACAFQDVTGGLRWEEIVELREIVNKASRLLGEPDHGKWEVRDEGRHWVYSKLFLWTCLDRGIRIAESCGDMEAPIAHWKKQRADIRREILDKGFDEDVGAFVQSYGSRNLDASALRIPLVGFIDGDDPRMLSTLDRLSEGLGDGLLLHRYDPEETRDGVGGPEGAFLLSSFEMVSALVLADRIEEAQDRFEALCAHSGTFGLFSEQMLPDGTMLGNYPQAFSHLGLINAAVNLDASGQRDALHDWTG
jgi:alpha,alpha-trehalase